jgi:hypothetical protein
MAGYNYDKRGSYGNNNNRNNNSYQGAQKKIVKHSGAKTKRYFPTTGPNAGVEQSLTSGWKLANRDLISIRCVTTSKSKLSEKGWLGSIACTLTNTKSGVQSFHWGTMHHSTGKVVIDAIAMVINPKAKNGGYSGTYINN